MDQTQRLIGRLKPRQPYKHPLELMLDELSSDVTEATVLLGQGDYPTVRALVMQAVADMSSAADIIRQQHTDASANRSFDEVLRELIDEWHNEKGAPLNEVILSLQENLLIAIGQQEIEQ